MSKVIACLGAGLVRFGFDHVVTVIFLIKIIGTLGSQIPIVLNLILMNRLKRILIIFLAAVFFFCFLTCCKLEAPLLCPRSGF